MRGFIAQSKPGRYNMKDPSSRRATEWRLTWQRCNDQPPTKEFMDYSKKITVQNIETPRPKNLDTGEQNAPDCPKNLDQSRQKRALTGQNNMNICILAIGTVVRCCSAGGSPIGHLK